MNNKDRARNREIWKQLWRRILSAICWILEPLFWLWDNKKKAGNSY